MHYLLVRQILIEYIIYHIFSSSRLIKFKKLEDAVKQFFLCCLVSELNMSFDDQRALVWCMGTVRLAF